MSTNYFEHIDKNIKDKYSNYLITSQKNHTPPFEWSEGIFQRFKPISGNFKIGDNFYGNMQCVNNQTGRAFYANPCGYWQNSDNQFSSGTILQNKTKFNMNGSLFPVGKISNEIMTNPNNRVVFGYARIGEEMRNR